MEKTVKKILIAISDMKKIFFSLIILMSLFGISSCSRLYSKTNIVVPITYEQETEFGNLMYKNIMRSSDIDSKVENINKVHNIASRIIKIANLYTDVRCNEKSTLLNQLYHKIEKLIDEEGDIRKVNLKISKSKARKCYYDWNAFILKNPQASSSVIKTRLKISNLPVPNTVTKISDIKHASLPGGKIILSDETLENFYNESELAFIISHEVSHVILRHYTEKLHIFLLAKLGSRYIENKLENFLKEKSSNITQLNIDALGYLSFIVFEKPFSLEQEYEADSLALRLMAQAGFNPEKAKTVFQVLKMGSEKESFFPSHPSPDSRIDNINKSIDDAIKIYKKGRKGL